ncbi:hypothetical protein TWF481_002920 [Arthrobotrys musiformis]|uniref:Uncharacterized protein n=1 Tax=Arthrobotrys musiformis TaxID=47236 RepID=A0AAV9VRN0_9PEZI
MSLDGLFDTIEAYHGLLGRLEKEGLVPGMDVPCWSALVLRDHLRTLTTYANQQPSVIKSYFAANHACHLANREQHPQLKDIFPRKPLLNSIGFPDTAYGSRESIANVIPIGYQAAPHIDLMEVVLVAGATTKLWIFYKTPTSEVHTAIKPTKDPRFQPHPQHCSPPCGFYRYHSSSGRTGSQCPFTKMVDYICKLLRSDTAPWRSLSSITNCLKPFQKMLLDIASRFESTILPLTPIRLACQKLRVSIEKLRRGALPRLLKTLSLRHAGDRLNDAVSSKEEEKKERERRAADAREQQHRQHEAARASFLLVRRSRRFGFKKLSDDDDDEEE